MRATQDHWSIPASYPDVLVAAVSQQGVRHPAAVLPPGLIDLQHHGNQPSRPLLQEPLTHGLQVAHHKVQYAPVGHVVEQEAVDILLFCAGEKTVSHL